MCPQSLDKLHMARCQELARQARLSGNVPVGSVIVLDDAIVVEAGETVPTGPDPFAHAELIVVREALRKFEKDTLRHATLYTNQEPCLLCSFAIREAGIGRVVIENQTPEIGGVSSSYPILVATDISRWGAPPSVVWI